MQVTGGGESGTTYNDNDHTLPGLPPRGSPTLGAPASVRVCSCPPRPGHGLSPDVDPPCSLPCALPLCSFHSRFSMPCCLLAAPSRQPDASRLQPYAALNAAHGSDYAYMELRYVLLRYILTLACCSSPQPPSIPRCVRATARAQPACQRHARNNDRPASRTSPIPPSRRRRYTLASWNQVSRPSPVSQIGCATERRTRAYLPGQSARKTGCRDAGRRGRTRTSRSVRPFPCLLSTNSIARRAQSSHSASDSVARQPGYYSANTHAPGLGGVCVLERPPSWHTGPSGVRALSQGLSLAYAHATALTSW